MSTSMRRSIKSSLLHACNRKKSFCVIAALGIASLAIVLLTSLLLFKNRQQNGIASDVQLIDHQQLFPRQNAVSYLRRLLFEAVAANKLPYVEASFPDDESSNAGTTAYTNHTVRKYHLAYRGDDVPPLVRGNIGKVLNDVTNFRYPIDAPRKHDGCSDLLLLALVISAPVNYLKREIIRRTWASTLSHISSKERSSLLQQASYVFFIGLPKNETEQRFIEEESDTWGDIVQVDFVDQYHLLTTKSVSMLNWALKTCNSTKFFLKIDDDVYLNTHTLMYNIQEMSRLGYHQVPSIYGSLVPEHLPIRDPSETKAYISYDAWPWSTFPSYLIGGSYLIASGALSPLLGAAQVVPHAKFEDMYITSLCARQAMLKVMATPRFFVLGNPPVDHCFVMKSVTWEAKEESKFMQSFWALRDIYEQKTFPKIEYLICPPSENTNV